MRSSLSQYGYTGLDNEQTEQFVQASAQLMDEVFQTEEDFREFFKKEDAWLHADPADFFEHCFDSLEKLELSKYQRGFLDYARINYGTILKWYRKNGGTINLSEKQLAWTKRWMTKHGIHTPFLKQQEAEPVVVPTQTTRIKPKLGIL